MRCLDDCPHRSFQFGKRVPGGIALVAGLAVLAGMSLVDPAMAMARGSGYMRGMQQMMIKTAQAQQKMAQAIQKQQEANYKAFMERFDTNHDGKLTGKERGPATKYLREIDLGLDPDASLKKQKRSTMKLGKKKPTKK